MAAVAVAIALFGGQAAAQTCANPLPIVSNVPVSGDTCTAANSLPSYGGTTSAQNEIVYSFVAGPTPPTYGDLLIAQTGGFAGSAGGVFLLPACTASTDPIAFGVVGAPLSVSTSGITPGQTYYVVVTADPGGPAAGCGQFTITPGYLPVSLQKFSVE
ncbi:hypothetical protein [Tahibacter sp.]|uniref:hypothetical protein n=1 Tax=Tahibacter sp. TaxID=2056211 RepID=UPI0028C47D04|nr:hypothetical protein [Tahibacter sp.]